MNEASNTIRDMVVGAAIAAFAAVIWILYEPANKRPSLWGAVGRIGVAMVASLVAGAVASDIFGASPKLTYAACGAAGIFGERVFAAVARGAKRYGIDLSEEEDDNEKA